MRVVYCEFRNEFRDVWTQQYTTDSRFHRSVTQVNIPKLSNAEIKLFISSQEWPAERGRLHQVCERDQLDEISSWWDHQSVEECRGEGRAGGGVRAAARLWVMILNHIFKHYGIGKCI